LLLKRKKIKLNNSFKRVHFVTHHFISLPYKTTVSWSIAKILISFSEGILSPWFCFRNFQTIFGKREKKTNRRSISWTHRLFKVFGPYILHRKPSKRIQKSHKIRSDKRCFNDWLAKTMFLRSFIYRKKNRRSRKRQWFAEIVRAYWLS
jgi:hypothetical protein